MSQSTIVIDVDGVPRAEPRPRFDSRPDRHGRTHAYRGQSAEPWKLQIFAEARRRFVGPPIEDYVSVEMVFFMPRPGRLNDDSQPEVRLPHGCKPDVDNLAKAVLDALTRAGMWKDDSLVVDLRARKFYHAKDARPGVEIVIMPFRDREEEQ